MQHYGKESPADLTFLLVGYAYLIGTVTFEFLVNHWQVLLFLGILILLGYLRWFDDGALFLLSFIGTYILISLLEYHVIPTFRRWRTEFYGALNYMNERE